MFKRIFCLYHFHHSFMLFRLMNQKDFLETISENKEEFAILQKEWMLYKQDLYTLLGYWNFTFPLEKNIENDSNTLFTKHSSQQTKDQKILENDEILMKVREVQSGYTSKYYEIKEFKCSIEELLSILIIFLILSYIIGNNSDLFLSNYNQVSELSDSLERFAFTIEEDIQLMVFSFIRLFLSNPYLRCLSL